MGPFSGLFGGLFGADGSVSGNEGAANLQGQAAQGGLQNSQGHQGWLDSGISISNNTGQIQNYTGQHLGGLNSWFPVYEPPKYKIHPGKKQFYSRNVLLAGNNTRVLAATIHDSIHKSFVKGLQPFVVEKIKAALDDKT